MANRDKPVNGKGSKLSVLKNGNLMLMDAGQFVVWTTDINSGDGSGNNNNEGVELFLYDTGNLVLRERTNSGYGSVRWQSFDSPTDTLLPGQVLTRYMKLVSSRSESNYSSGYYQLFFDNDNLLRLLYDGPQVSSVYWPDPWLVSWAAQRSTYNSTRVAILNHFGSFTSSDDFNLKTSDFGTTIIQRRLTLDHDGNVRVYSRKNGEEEWLVTGQFKQQPCKIHGICGPNSVCENDPVNGRSCSCLPGYTRVNLQDWNQGCKPKFDLSCNNKTKSRFQFIPHVEFYGYDFGFYENYTYKQCEHLCLSMCQCIGFQYNKFEGDNVFKCYPKTQLLNGYHSPNFCGSMFLRLPISSDFSRENPVEDNGLVCLGNETTILERPYFEGKENGSLKFMLWFAIGFEVIEVLCIFLVWRFLIRNRENFGDDTHGYVLASATLFRKFSYSELQQATKNFSKEIGRGGGVIVYKGVLPDNRVAAIKRLYEANQGEIEFLAEASIIGRLNHMNLIGMWGYCAEGKHRLLVYEYMENGSLAENLLSNSLDWKKRYNIALGVARGLAYLHEECLEWILHCDIKPQNILLDCNFQPKVADFGLSKLLERSNNLKNSSFSRMRGTRGYMAPEWVFNLPITSKVDVYSYGVVVLEMITGKSSMTGVEVSEGGESHNERLVTWVREKKRRGSKGGFWVEEIVDPVLGSNYEMNEMESLVMLALECVEEEKDVRPSMSQIAERLQSHENA